MTTTKTETADQLDIVERLKRVKYTRERNDAPNGFSWDEPCDADDYGAEQRFVNPDGPEAADEIEKLREECNLLREQCNLLRKHCDRMASLAIDNAKDTERAMLYRELLQKWLGNCFVDVYGHGVTFGMGVRKVWAETRDALKDGE